MPSDIWTITQHSQWKPIVCLISNIDKFQYSKENKPTFKDHQKQGPKKASSIFKANLTFNIKM